MKPPNHQKEVQTFIGVMNYYCGMRPWWSHALAPLARLMSIFLINGRKLNNISLTKLSVLWHATLCQLIQILMKH